MITKEIKEYQSKTLSNTQLIVETVIRMEPMTFLNFSFLYSSMQTATRNES